MLESYSVRRFADADAFLARAGPWLLEAEAENNLIIALATRLQDEAHDVQPYLAAVEQDDEVMGCVLCTPPYKPILTRMPYDAVFEVVADLREVYPAVPAVLGPDPQARRFAELWSLATGASWQAGMRQRIYQLSRVRLPTRPPPGMLRVAEREDVDLITSWIIAFSDEVSMPVGRARSMAEERVRRGELFLWMDHEPCAMAAWSGRTPNSVRIGYVYTPPDRRGRGYASACTARVSQRALTAGYRYCFLFTDLSNPTSNAIYQAIGYEPVADVHDYVFDEHGQSS